MANRNYDPAQTSGRVAPRPPEELIVKADASP